MQKLLVYADFDWLKEPTLVGELSYESLRGTDSYGFCFDEEWLRTQGGLFLSADLNNYLGIQYTTGGSDIFGCFSDTLPEIDGGSYFAGENRLILADSVSNCLLRELLLSQNLNCVHFSLKC